LTPHQPSFVDGRRRVARLAVPAPRTNSASGPRRAAHLCALALGLGAALWLGGAATTAPIAAAPARDPAAQAATQTATPLVRLTPPTATSAARTATSPARTSTATALVPAPPTDTTPPRGGDPTEQSTPDRGTAGATGAAPTGAAGTRPPPDGPSTPAPIAPPVLSSAPALSTALPVVRRVGPFGVPQVVDDPAAAALWRGAAPMAGTSRPPGDLEAGAGPAFDPAGELGPAGPPGGPVLLGVLAAAFAALAAFAARGLWRSAG